MFGLLSIKTERLVYSFVFKSPTLFGSVKIIFANCSKSPSCRLYCQAASLLPPSSTLASGLQASLITAITTSPVTRAVASAVMIPTSTGLTPPPRQDVFSTLSVDPMRLDSP